MNYADFVKNTTHLDALGMYEVWLDDDFEQIPWEIVDHVESGGVKRCLWTVNIRLVARVGLFRIFWFIDIEPRNASGLSTAVFDRALLRDIAARLPQRARESYAGVLKSNVLDGLSKHVRDVKQTLSACLDAEECIRNIVNAETQA